MDSNQYGDIPPSGLRVKLRAVGVASGLTIATFLGSTLIGLFVILPLILLDISLESSGALLALLIATQVGFFCVGFLYVRRYGLEIPFHSIGRRDLGYAIGGLFVALGFATGASLVLNTAGLTTGAVLEEAILQDPLIAIWLAILSICIVAPIEEYVFRGVIQGRLRETFNAPGAIIGASLLFGTLHLGNYIGSVEAILGWSLLISGVGVIFGILYERTGTLLVPILVHAAYNAVLFVMSYLSL
jgi:uncharacterized protein